MITPFKPGDKVRIASDLVDRFIGTFGYINKVYTIIRQMPKDISYLTDIDEDVWGHNWFVLANGSQVIETTITNQELVLTEAERELILNLRSTVKIFNAPRGRKFKEDIWQR